MCKVCTYMSTVHTYVHMYVYNIHKCTFTVTHRFFTSDMSNWYWYECDAMEQKKKLNNGYVRTYVRIYVKYVFLSVSMMLPQIRIHTHLCRYIHRYTHVHTYVPSNLYVRTYIQYVYIRTYVCTLWYTQHLTMVL